MVIQQSSEQNLVIGILSQLLKGRSRIRVMLLFQSAFVFAFFSIRRSSGDHLVPKVEEMLLPVVVGELDRQPSRLRSKQQQDAGSNAANETISQTLPLPSEQHSPHYFSEEISFEALLARDNILSVYTGCSIAAWTYGWHTQQPRLASFYDDCGHYNAEKQWDKDVTVDNVSEVQAGDTIYVELMKLDHFVQHLLPLIKVEFVLISGQNHIAPMKPPLKPPYSKRNTFRPAVDNPNVKSWFMMNLDKHSHDPFHPKHHPFPYGLSYVARGGGTPADFNPSAKAIYAKELRRKDVMPKNRTVFVGYLNRDSNPDRANVPSGKKLPPDEYYKTMRESKYVLSPDGDRPECYRHYEAIGLGTMPITQLHPHLYRHLEGNVRFNETTWNVKKMETTLPSDPIVNRRLLFEEYWMEYVERSVGGAVRWWDSTRQVRTSLADITNTAKSEVAPPKIKAS